MSLTFMWWSARQITCRKLDSLLSQDPRDELAVYVWACRIESDLERKKHLPRRLIMQPFAISLLRASDASRVEAIWTIADDGCKPELIKSDLRIDPIICKRRADKRRNGGRGQSYSRRPQLVHRLWNDVDITSLLQFLNWIRWTEAAIVIVV